MLWGLLSLMFPIEFVALNEHFPIYECASLKPTVETQRLKQSATHTEKKKASPRLFLISERTTYGTHLRKVWRTWLLNITAVRVCVCVCVLTDWWWTAAAQVMKATQDIKKITCEWRFDTQSSRQTVLHTYVSLSSHEMQVSFTVPCKREADGRVSVRTLSKQNVLAATLYWTCVTGNSLTPATFPHFSPAFAVICTRG